MLNVVRGNKFNKSIKKYKNKKKELQEFYKVIDFLIDEKEIPKKYEDHELKGNMKGIRELHLGFDDLLLYFIRSEENELILVDIGTHSHTLKK